MSTSVELTEGIEMDVRHSPFFVPSPRLAVNYKNRRLSAHRCASFPHKQSSGPPLKLRESMSSCSDPRRSQSPSPLRRSGSFLSLSELSGPCPRIDPYVSVHGFIDNREKPFKTLSRSSSSSASSKPPQKATKPETPCSYYHAHSPKTPSPLSGHHQTTETYRPSFPRSKPQPDLYKLAITAHMRSSFQVNQEREIALEQQRRQQIDAGFRIGSPLAVSIMNATRDLEVLVASHQQQQQQRDADGDVPMSDCPSTSLFTSTLAGEDWEMIDCAC